MFFYVVPTMLLFAKLSPSPSMLYLDALPPDILRGIVAQMLLPLRKITVYEQSPEVQRKVHERIQLVSVLFSRKLPFCDQVSKMFSMISVDLVCHAPYFSAHRRCITIGPGQFNCEELNPGLGERILKLCGESATEIRFAKIHDRNPLLQSRKEKSVAQTFVSLVVRHYPNVEKIIFESAPPSEDIVPALFSRFSSQLRSIVWDEPINSENYRRIPDLSMCAQIRKLDFPCSPQLLSFLRASGSSLEILHVSLSDKSLIGESMDIIQSVCCNLTEVCFKYFSQLIPVVGEERYASFLSSFGARLTKADFTQLSSEKFQQVYTACPNLSINTLSVLNNKLDDWKKVSIAAEKLDRLSVGLTACVDERFKDAIEKCKNLQLLRIGNGHSDEKVVPSTTSVLRFLSSMPLSSISDFTHFKFEASRRNIEILASTSWNLRQFHLFLAKPIAHGVDFRSIAESNPQLFRADIHEYVDDDGRRSSDSALDLLRMLVRSFSKCRELKFTISNKYYGCVTQDEIRDICGILPCRRMYVDIKVGNTYYGQGDFLSHWANFYGPRRLVHI